MIVAEAERIASFMQYDTHPVVAAVRPSPHGPLVEWRGVEDQADDLLIVLARMLALRWRDGTPRIPADWRDALHRQFPGVFDECGPHSYGGWRWLWEAGASLSAEAGEQIVSLQTKEKFGQVRWYARVMKNGHKTDGGRSMRIIACVEGLSLHVCEYCGAPGILRPGGWAKTCCEIHAVRANRQNAR